MEKHISTVKQEFYSRELNITPNSLSVSDLERLWLNQETSGDYSIPDGWAKLFSQNGVSNLYEYFSLTVSNTDKSVNELMCDFYEISSQITPVTEGMTLTASWVTRGADYTELRNAQSASVRVEATIANTDSGILMEAGASGVGLVLYVYSGVLYFQCGDGDSFGTSSVTSETSYTLPAGTITPIIEWSGDTSNAVLYIDGVEVDSQTYSSSALAGNNSGTVGQVMQDVAENRGGWTNTNLGSYTNTITRCDIFLGQITPDV
jgi:hypothetical protein